MDEYLEGIMKKVPAKEMTADKPDIDECIARAERDVDLAAGWLAADKDDADAQQNYQHCVAVRDFLRAHKRLTESVSEQILQNQLADMVKKRPVAGGIAVSAAEDLLSAAGESPAFTRWCQEGYGDVRPQIWPRLRDAFDAGVKQCLTTVQRQLADADRRAAGRPEPVAWIKEWDTASGSHCVSLDWVPHRPDGRTQRPLLNYAAKPLYGPDLLAHADRVAAERDRHMGAVQAYIEDAEHLTRQLARETARADAWVKEVRDLARELGIADEDSNGSIHDWRHVKYKLRQLAELQAKHDALVKRLRDPTPEMLKFLCDCDSDLMPGESLADAAMSAVALDKGGE